MDEKILEEELLTISKLLSETYGEFVGAKTRLSGVLADIQLYEIKMMPDGGWTGSNTDARKTAKATAEAEHLNYQWALGQKRELEKAILIAETRIKFLHDQMRIYQSIIEVRKLTKVK